MITWCETPRAGGGDGDFYWGVCFFVRGVDWSWYRRNQGISTRQQMVQEELKREREREKHLKYIILVAKNKKIWDNSKWEKSLLRI